MPNNNLITQMIYRIITCCVSALAVLLTCRIFYAGQPLPLTWDFLKFYTNLSNYVVFVVSVIVLADNVKRVYAGERKGYNKKIRTFKFMTTFAILLTFLVYLFFLGRVWTAQFWRDIANLCLHVFAPLLFIFDYLLFDEKKSVSVYAPLLSLIMPVVYLAVILIIGAIFKDFKYPYFFLNVHEIGYGGVALWVSGLLVVFTGLGYLLWLYNRRVKVDGKYKLDLKDINWLHRPDPPSEHNEKNDESDNYAA